MGFKNRIEADGLPTRRKLLGGMVSATGISAAAMLGISGAATSANAQTVLPDAPEELVRMARLRSYQARRSSSWDRTGGNRDAIAV